jgi:3'-phosphoadenosine 5'-phosphosulfate sulfotransferase (PAPS reductase)/FAD synthetase
MLYAYRNGQELLPAKHPKRNRALPHRRRHDLHRRVRSTATTIPEIVKEIAATRITERGETRADDKTSEAAMEDRKKAGYF